MKKPSETIGSKIAIVSIFSVIVILLVTGVCFAVNLAKKFSYRNIGVEYGDGEISSLDKKLDIEYSNKNNGEDNSGDSGNILEELRKQGKVLGIDYTIEYSDFEYKTILLTSSEATALINERMPSFSFLNNAQIKVCDDGYVEFSTGCNVEKTVDFLFPNTDVEIPSTASETANAYVRSKLNVVNDVMYVNDCTVESGILSLLPVQIESDMQVGISNMLKNAPDLVITDIHVTTDKMFSVSGMLPTKATVVML